MAKGTKLKDRAIGRKDLFTLDPDKIVVDPSWNVRVRNEALDDHIKELAVSIADLGVQQPITVYTKGGKEYLTDGFCRLAAVKLARAAGADIKGIPARVEERSSNEADYVLSMFTRNSGKPLLFIEQAHVVKRLMGFGWDKKTIAKKTGKSITHIDNCELAMGSHPDIVKALQCGLVSARLALETIRSKGDAAHIHIAEHIHKAKESGKKKASKRTANNAAKNKADREPVTPKGLVAPSKISWSKHGPDIFSFFGKLFKAYDGLDTVPDDIADIIKEARDYFEDLGIKV